MKKLLRITMIVLLLLTIGTTSLYASSTTTTVTETYGNRLEVIMQMILDKYLDSNDLNADMLFEAAMSGMFDILDPYSDYIAADNAENFSNSLNNTYVGIGVQLIQEGDYVVIDRVFLNGSAYTGGLHVHDKIIGVGNVSLIGKTPGDAAALIVGREGTKVTLKIDRQGYVFDIQLTRMKVTINAIDQLSIQQADKTITDAQAKQIGYLKLSSFTNDVDEELAPILAKYKSEGRRYLLLDLRDNGGGYVDSALGVLNQLVPAGPVLKFVNNEGREIIYSSQLQDPYFKIVALINGNSASATEFVSAAIQESSVGTLVGETTYGKGVAQYLYTLDDGAVVKLTQEAFYTGKGKAINKIGVTPDVIVAYPKYLTKVAKYYPYDQQDEVVNVEMMLQQLGYDVDTPDRLYDKKTFEAIKKFQKDQKVYAYGICDYTTQNLLNQAFIANKREKDDQLNKGIELLLKQIN